MLYAGIGLAYSQPLHQSQFVHNSKLFKKSKYPVFLALDQHSAPDRGNRGMRTRVDEAMGERQD
jgi:hypothetical protein